MIGSAGDNADPGFIGGYIQFEIHILNAGILDFTKETAIIGNTIQFAGNGDIALTFKDTLEGQLAFVCTNAQPFLLISKINILCQNKNDFILVAHLGTVVGT